MDHELQATGFLHKCKAEMTVIFLWHDSHFDGEDKTLDIYLAIFRRPGRNGGFSIEFGQSLDKSTGDGRNKPTAYDVLSCLPKFNPYDFEDFCSNCGLDTDSRLAEKSYRAVASEWAKVKGFFSKKEITALGEIN